MRVIVDNLSAHKTKQVRAFLENHPNVALHVTPTYLSWLKQIELWLAEIDRDVAVRGVFTSVTNLNRKPMKHICEYNKFPRTVKW